MYARNLHLWSGMKIKQEYWANLEKRRKPHHPVIRAFVEPKLNFIKENIRLSKNTKILDVGCGNGFFSYYFEKICDTTGIDFSEKMIKLNPIKKKYVMDAYNLKFKNNSFDVVFCSNLLHHLDNPKKAVKEMIRVSKKYIVVSEPNRNNPFMFLFGLFKRGERSTLKVSSKFLKRFFGEEKIINSTISGLVFPNKTPKRLLPFLKRLDFKQPLGAYCIVIAKK